MTKLATTSHVSCPFCGGHCSFTTDCDGEGTPAAFHTFPTCKRFNDSEDALSFLQEVNHELCLDN